MRDKTDHEATAMMKAQFMSLWDGKWIVTEKVALYFVHIACYAVYKRCLTKKYL